jgi:Trk-type K+ transport system membrane component
MTVVLAIGVLLCGAGVVLFFNVGRAGDAVIRRVTSRSLGELAPGFAATRIGFKVYAALVLYVGLAVAGVGAADWSPWLGVALFFFGLAGFVGASGIAIVGEVRTYRALKR